MNWILSVLTGVLSGVAGMCAAGFVAAGCVSWYRISSFEGKAGYFVVFTALVGGIAGFVIGLVTARAVASGINPGFLKSLAWSMGVVIGTAGLSAGIARVLADVPPEINGHPLELAVEVRLPRGQTEPPVSGKEDSYLTLGSVAGHVQRSSERGELRLLEAKLLDGRWTIPGSVFLFTSRGRRSLDVVLGGKSCAGFLVPLPARPGPKYEQWSDWLPHPRPGDPPWPDTKPCFRFRVQQILPPPLASNPEVVEGANP